MRLKNTLTYIILSLTFCLVHTSRAEEVRGLFTATVPVKSQSIHDRKRAINDAFKKVIVKLSGNSALPLSAKIKSSLQTAMHYMEEYNYFRGDDIGTLQLRVRFQKEPLKKLLQSNYSLWGKNRPLVLAWVAVKMGETVNLLGSDSENEISDTLQASAKERAVPLVLPVIDIHALSALRASDVWQFKMPAIERASKSYGAAAILVMSLMQQGGDDNWMGLSRLTVDEKTFELNAQGHSSRLVVKDLLDKATDRLAKEYTSEQVQADAMPVELSVENITDLTAYGQLLKHLTNATNVKEVEVLRVQPTQVTLRLKVIGGLGQLQRDLSLDSALRLSDANTTDATGASVQTYRWLR